MIELPNQTKTLGEPHMQPSENQPIRQYWQLCQQRLFPVLEEGLGPLGENYRRLAAALAWLGGAGERARRGGHVIRDAPPLPVRERCRRKTAPPLQRRPRGRPGKGSPPAPKKRLDRQPGMQLAEMLDDVPKHGDWSVRFEERGRKQRWKGYKLHCDLRDSGLPLSYVLTSASLHDSQAAIPLATLTSRRVNALYELMDAGYYSHTIRQYCEQLGHVVLIPDVPPAGQPKRAFSPAQRQRYEQRRLIEQFFALLKDHFGLRFIRVRGHAKVFLQVQLAILILTLERVLRLSP